MTVVVRGFCQSRDQEAALKGYGITPKSVWMAGRGAEDFARCLSTYRGRPGMLILAHDLRALGTTKKVVANAMAKLEKAEIRVIDITHPEDTTVAALVQRASVAISGVRMTGRQARKRGRTGGIGKGHHAQEKRENAVPAAFVERVVQHAEIPWRVKLEILGPTFKPSTLRRHYGAAGRGK